MTPLDTSSPCACWIKSSPSFQWKIRGWGLCLFSILFVVASPYFGDSKLFWTVFLSWWGLEVFEMVMRANALALRAIQADQTGIRFIRKSFTGRTEQTALAWSDISHVALSPVPLRTGWWEPCRTQPLIFMLRVTPKSPLFLPLRTEQGSPLFACSEAAGISIEAWLAQRFGPLESLPLSELKKMPVWAYVK